MAGSLVSLAAAVLVFVLVLLPPGYALARLLRIEARGLPRAAIAFGLGYSALLPIVFVLRGSAGPAVAVVLATLSLLWLRPGIDAAKRALRESGGALGLPVALALLAVVVNGHDFTRGAAGADVALGFDVSDRIFYATIAQELGRPGATLNPLFAGLPLQYAFFPSLAGRLVHGLTGAPLLDLFLTGLPALGILLVALFAQAVLEDWGVGPRGLRVASAALVVLGGDFSFLVPVADSAILERFRHFFVFYSFSGESLYYNPWFFGLPVVFAALLLARRALDSGTLGSVAGAALVIGGLWQTKPFACLALVAGCVLYGAFARRGRALALAAGSLLAAAPWIALSLASGAGRGGFPLAPSFLYLVQAAIGGNPPLRAVARALGVDSAGPVSRALGIASFTALFLLGGFALRLAGLGRLVRDARRSASGIHGLVAATLLVCVSAGLCVEGRPTELEGVQFLLLAQALLWLYAAPALLDLAASGGPARRALGTGLCLVAVVSPLGYAARKAAPSLFTRDGAPDRLRYRLTAGFLDACRFLQEHADPSDPVAVPLAGPADPWGQRPMLVAALAERRVAGAATPFHVDARTVEARAGLLRTLYAAETPEAAAAAASTLGVRWLWVDEGAPLRAEAPGLQLRHAAGGVRLYELPRP